MSDPTPRNENFADQLIAAQRVEPTLRQRYEQEMKAMLEQPLTKTRKITFTLSAILCTIMMVLLTIAAVSSHRAPIGVRIGLGLGAVYAAGWLIMVVRIIRRGALNLRSDSQMMSAWPWVFTVTLVTLILFMTGQRADSVRSVWMLLFGLTFLLMASMFLIQHWITEARMKVEERLLEVQLRVAELAEQLSKRG
ncbi:MAG: hypothetical protein QOF78_4039 [Phycisphaerales bacterium]|jgi:hypothetical protein|nr:hypothetical protein [Phycisphaerales bacterium]